MVKICFVRPLSPPPPRLTATDRFRRNAEIRGSRLRFGGGADNNHLRRVYRGRAKRTRKTRADDENRPGAPRMQRKTGARSGHPRLKAELPRFRRGVMNGGHAVRNQRKEKKRHA